ncbi:MAG: SAM-dependent methyltransferase, partial [Planctomycetales bacterium]
GDCLALVLSGKRKDAPLDADKLTLRPVAVRGEPGYQLAWRRGGRETHENLSPREALARIEESFATSFEHCHAFTPQADYHARLRGRGRVKLTTGPPSKRPAGDFAAHDRGKRRLIPEGEPCSFLAEIGVMTPAGAVKAPMTKKFRQINRFLELVDDVVPQLPPGPLEVVDFGCGKSYLTFALDHLLRNVRGRDLRIVGLDLKEDVIAECRRVAERLGLSHIEFRVGDIAAYEPPGRVDLAVSLHACDTATDAALAQAVRWETPVILAVPCCQHELARTIAAGELSPLLRHGILKERLAALATDALRAEVLEQHGYRTQVVEFIDLEHTAKNLLIRAVRRDGAAPRDDRAAEYRRLKELLGIEDFHLERALAEERPSSP